MTDHGNGTPGASPAAGPLTPSAFVGNLIGPDLAGDPPALDPWCLLTRRHRFLIAVWPCVDGADGHVGRTPGPVRVSALDARRQAAGILGSFA